MMIVDRFLALRSGSRHDAERQLASAIGMLATAAALPFLHRDRYRAHSFAIRQPVPVGAALLLRGPGALPRTKFLHVPRTRQLPIVQDQIRSMQWVWQETVGHFVDLFPHLGVHMGTTRRDRQQLLIGAAWCSRPAKRMSFSRPHPQAAPTACAALQPRSVPTQSHTARLSLLVRRSWSSSLERHQLTYLTVARDWFSRVTSSARQQHRRRICYAFPSPSVALTSTKLLFQHRRRIEFAVKQ